MFIKRSLLLVILLVIAVHGQWDEEEDDPTPLRVDPNRPDLELAPIVKVVEGELRGKILKSHGGKDIYTYLGVPYAKPPLGELRFSYPRRPDHWSGVRDATSDGAKCPHLSYPERRFEGEENCLFANVYTSKLPNATERIDVATLHDVVVVIHDGSFTYNSGHSDAYMPDHLLDEDIVLVTFNYRLGVLGFMTTDDEWAVGNYGMKDQVELLHWVHRNIIEFGGNPTSVTLLGAEAGGSSAHLLMLSPMAKDRFHGAISISGTALSPWAVVDPKVAKKRTEKLAKLVGCSKRSMKSSESIVKCLRNKYTLDLVTEAKKIMEWGTDKSHPFVPTVEPMVPNFRQFLPRHPIKLMETLPEGPQGRWEKPWLIGVAKNEALPQALQSMVFPYIMNSLNTNPGKYVPLFLGMEVTDTVKKLSIGQEIWDFYLKNETLKYGNLNRLEEMATDYNVFHGVFRSVSLHSKASTAPIFAYRFSFDFRTNLMSLGVPSGDEMELLFPNIVATKKREYKKAERPIVNSLVKFVANFAKYGDPTPEGSELLGSLGLWPQATGDSFEFIDIGKEFTLHEGFYEERIQFWDKIEERILNEETRHDEL